MRFKTSTEFKHFLDGTCIALTGKLASTHRQIEKEPRIEACDQSWWITGRNDGNSRSSHDRNRAYLISYFTLIDKFPAIGLQLQDGSYVNADKSVIDRSIRDGHVAFNKVQCSFSLTDEGSRFLNERFGN